MHTYQRKFRSMNHHVKFHSTLSYTTLHPSPSNSKFTSIARKCFDTSYVKWFIDIFNLFVNYMYNKCTSHLFHKTCICIKCVLFNSFIKQVQKYTALKFSRKFSMYTCKAMCFSKYKQNSFLRILTSFIGFSKEKHHRILF